MIVAEAGGYLYLVGGGADSVGSHGVGDQSAERGAEGVEVEWVVDLWPRGYLQPPDVMTVQKWVTED